MQNDLCESGRVLAAPLLHFPPAVSRFFSSGERSLRDSASLIIAGLESYAEISTSLVATIFSSRSTGGVDDRAICAGSDVWRAGIATSVEGAEDACTARMGEATPLSLETGMVGDREAGASDAPAGSLVSCAEGEGPVGVDTASVDAVLSCESGRAWTAATIRIVSTRQPTKYNHTTSAA